MLTDRNRQRFTCLSSECAQPVDLDFISAVRGFPPHLPKFALISSVQFLFSISQPTVCDGCDSNSANPTQRARRRSRELGKVICRCGSRTLNCFQTRCVRTVGEAKLWMSCEQEGPRLPSPTLGGSLQVVQLWSEASAGLCDNLEVCPGSNQTLTSRPHPCPSVQEKCS